MTYLKSVQELVGMEFLHAGRLLRIEAVTGDPGGYTSGFRCRVTGVGDRDD